MERGGGTAWVAQAIEHVRANLGRRITPAGVAAAVGRSERWLRERVRRETGRSFSAFVTELRTEEAGRLLADTGMSVKQVAARVGFSSLPYFSRTFRRKTGLSPREYRDRHRRVKTAASTARRLADVFEDAPVAGSLARNWNAVAGDWREKDQTIAGEADDNLFLVLRRELPPLAEAEFDLLRERPAGRDVRSVVIAALSPDARSFLGGYRFHLGRLSTRQSHMVRGDTTVDAANASLSYDT